MSIKQNTHIPVFLSSDDNYAAYMSALMVSIMDNTKSQIDFYVIDAGISDFNKKRMTFMQEEWGFGLEFIKAEDYRHLFKFPAGPSGHVTQASYDRYLIPYMKPELDRAIVLDVDMIALGDIRKLWELDLEGNLLAAVPVYCFVSRQNIEDLETTGVSPNHIYFNMGTLLLDCKKYREENILQKLANCPITFDTKKFIYWEEILLNLVLQENHYKILDPKFNMMVPHQAYYKNGKPQMHSEIVEDYAGLAADYQVDEIIFSHFAMRHVKPWNTNAYFYPPIAKTLELPNFKEFWYYMKKTPFYEGEKLNYLTKILNTKIAETAQKQIWMRDLFQYKHNLFDYYRYKLLANFTWGG